MFITHSDAPSLPRLLGSLCTALLLGPGACANPVDETPNRLPSIDVPDTADNDSPSSDASDGGCECLAVGQWYRFDSLSLLTIDGGDHPVLPTLNELWSADIKGNELNILLEIEAVSDAEVTARVVNGARIDGATDYCELSETAVTLVFPREGCKLLTSAESAFNVYAGTKTYPKSCSTTLPVKHAIPVSRARLEGTIKNDCSAITAGRVPGGGLAQSALDQLCTCLLLPGQLAETCEALDASYAEAPCIGCNANYSSLGQLLTAFGDVGWTCQTEAGTPAACITADYSATAVPAPKTCN
jgi:hypothetical protein